MIKKYILKYRAVLLLIIGSILITISLYLFLYSRIDLVKEQLFSEIDFMINNNSDYCDCECDSEIDYDETDDEHVVDIDTDYIEIEDNETSNNNNSSSNKKVYIGYLSIPRISLKYGLVAVGSYYNHVDRNIQIIQPSDFPDVSKGNFILAAHSGNSSLSFFKNLYRLEIGDNASVIYNSKTYNYKIVNIYKDDKDGFITIKRDTSKTTLTLITCSYKDEKNQTVYIAELESVI